LAYGWVFHIGFFSFYLSLGMCFWAIALGWHGSPRRWAAAAAVLAIAWTAHALPVVWTVAILLYRQVSIRLEPRARLLALIGSAMALGLLRVALGKWVSTRWFPVQITKTTGLDQVAVFGDKYQIVVIGLAVVWIGLFLGLEFRA